MILGDYSLPLRLCYRKHERRKQRCSYIPMPEPINYVKLKLVAFLLLLACTTMSLHAQAPAPPAWQFKFGGKVTEFNDKKQKDQALEGAVCTLFKGGQQVQSQVTTNSGKFKFVLDPNNEYTLTITKAGYITKRFTISTYNVPAERGEYPFAEFDVEIGLFKLFPGLDYSCLDRPIAKINFNPAPDVDDFDYDKVYTASIQQCIDELKRLEAEARAKQKLYDAAIEKADKAFNASNWQGAKDAYNEALGYLPNEQYPKDQIAKCDEKMGAAAANEQKYKDAIAAGDRLFGTSDWAGAKAKYQEASGIKPAEQYPKDQIVKCDANIAKAGADKQYNDLIADADAKFKAADFAGAKTKYQEAQELRAAEQYPKDQIVKCDAEIAKAANKAKYDAAIADADAKFKAADFSGAKTKYQEASALLTAEQYPKDQIVKCDSEIAKQGVQKQYDAAIADADAKFKAADYTGAKTKYQEASNLKATEQYPKDQMAKCDAELANADLKKKYDAAIADADAKFKAADFGAAKTKYQEASALKTTEQYPKDQIVKCDAEIAKQGVQKSYDAAIADADAKFKAADFSGAKAKYQEASGLKSTEQYPKDQIVKCEAELAAADLKKKYDAAIADADAKFKAADFSGAKTKYQEASGLKAAEQYPKDQIAKCDAEIAKQGLDKQYTDAIAAADKKFTAKDYAGAKADYQKASGLKAAEQYPKDQIAKCDTEITAADLKKKYDGIIADADAKFKAADWNGAKAKYQEASDLKTAEQYPKDQMVKCDANIAKAGVDKQYNDLIADADAKFKAADFGAAKAVYQQALDIKTAEAYPKAQIAKCDTEIAKKGVQEQYDAAIKDADAKFAGADWNGAKVKYQEASSLKAAEVYPKDQIKKCDANIAAESKNKQYSDLIAKADSSFKASDWSAAKSLYQQASAVKATETYPKEQIKLCDDNISKVGKDKQYADLIAKADEKFNASDWAAAKAIYLQASAVKGGEQYPKDQCAKCDANIAAAKDAAYNKIIASADSMFRLADYSGAKVKYKEASASRPAEVYPKDKIKECDDLAAKMGKDKQYADLITKADDKFKAEDWTAAKSFYQQASAVKTEEQYPKDQIAKCDEKISVVNTNKKYDDLIKQADTKFTASDWSGAKALYKQASDVKTAEQYPKDQMVKCDENIAKSGTDKSYNAAIAAADAKFKLSDWAGAKAKYEEALSVKAGEAYPTGQIAKCDENIKAAADKKYNDAIAAADAKFDAADWSGAKVKYQEALAMRPAEQYPKDRVTACDDNIAKSGLDKSYTAAIAAADAKFKASDWTGAKGKYQEALSMKAGEQYPKDQIAICDQNIANAAGLEERYSKAIARGDSAFKTEDYETAQSGYQQALDLKPGQAYPKAQLDEIKKRLDAISAGNAKEMKYRATIAKADSLFNLKEFAAAKVQYKAASTQKPAEQYPKDRIAQCDTEVSNQNFEAAKQKRYDDLIRKADAKFTAGSWSEAKKLYQDALREKPAELYPKQRIAECDKKLNPVTKNDTTRTPEQIKEDYRNEIARSYPQGLTTVEEKEGGTTTVKRIVVIGQRGYIYTKKVYSWGTFYFKDGVQISEGTFNYETSPGYIQQQQQENAPK